jgi:hypothetical protein
VRAVLPISTCLWPSLIVEVVEVLGAHRTFLCGRKANADGICQNKYQSTFFSFPNKINLTFQGLGITEMLSMIEFVALLQYWRGLGKNIERCDEHTPYMVRPLRTESYLYGNLHKL